MARGTDRGVQAMAMANGWLEWAARRPGVADKVYSQPNAGLGLALHSMEGSVRGSEARFFSPEREPEDPGRYTAYAAASTMFANPKTAALIQYYPVTASTWTSGNRKANTTLSAVESEGRAGEPLNGNQVENMLRLCREFEAHTALRAKRSLPGRTLWEHREVWDWEARNAGPTACPSGRYAPFYEALEGEMTPEERELLFNLGRIVLAGGEEGEKSREEIEPTVRWRAAEYAREPSLRERVYAIERRLGREGG